MNNQLGLFVARITLNQIFSGKYIRKGNMPNGQKEPESNKPTTQPLATRIAVGVAIGAGIGVALDNLAMGVAIGIAIGASIGAAQNQKNKNR